jgi:hypothetical protein
VNVGEPQFANPSLTRLPGASALTRRPRADTRGRHFNALHSGTRAPGQRRRRGWPDPDAGSWKPSRDLGASPSHSRSPLAVKRDADPAPRRMPCSRSPSRFARGRPEQRWCPGCGHRLTVPCSRRGEKQEWPLTGSVSPSHCEGTCVQALLNCERLINFHHLCRIL